MCGILGLVSKDPIDRGRAHAALDLIAHRGPDGDNSWHDSADNIWYGHRRHFWQGRWYNYGIGPCWLMTPIGYVWTCG